MRGLKPGYLDRLLVRRTWAAVALLVLLLALGQVVFVFLARPLDAAFAAPSVSASNPIPGFASFEQEDSRLIYSGRWTVVSDPIALGGSYCRTSSPGASVVVPFYGTGLDWLALKDAKSGLAEVRVDGGPPTVVDLKAAGPLYRQRVFSTGNLPLGLHVLTITRSSRSDTNTSISLDAVEVRGVAGYLGGTLGLTGRYEDTDARIEYQPAWIEQSGACFSAGRSQRSAGADSSLFLEFRGVYIALVAQTGPAYGSMRVILDGKQAATVDSHSPVIRCQQRVWSSGGLAPGRHTLRLLASEAANPAAEGRSINLDAVELAGELRDPSPSVVGRFDQQEAALHLLRIAYDIGVRPAGSPAEQKAADYAAGYLTSLGYQAHKEPVPLPNGRVSCNVVAVKPGVSASTIVVGAHLDSKPPSPGGNDNASGVAAVLELARCLRETTVVPTVVFVLFGAEEMIDSNRDHHHYGSRAYVAGLSEQRRKDLVGMISLDMVGFGNDFYVRSLGRGPRLLTDMLLRWAGRHGLPLSYLRDPSPYGYSDHEPFELQGIPAAWLQWRTDPQYHTAGDTRSHCNVSRIKQTGELVAGFLTELTEEDLSRLRKAGR